MPRPENQPPSHSIMNSTFVRLLHRAVPTIACILFSVTSLSAAGSAGAVDFADIPGPSGNGEQVEVQVPRNLIAIAARVVAREQPEVAKLLESIESVRVRVVGLDEGNRVAVQERMADVRADLVKNGWQKVVSVRDSGDDVAVFMRTGADDVIEGVTVTVISGNSEAVFVNIVGSVRPDQIADIAGAMHIPHLGAIAAVIEK